VALHRATVGPAAVDSSVPPSTLSGGQAASEATGSDNRECATQTRSFPVGIVKTARIQVRSGPQEVQSGLPVAIDHLRCCAYKVQFAMNDGVEQTVILHLPPTTGHSRKLVGVAIAGCEH